MKERGVNVKCLWKDPDAKKLEIKTLIYAKDNHSFIASKIGKGYTPTGLLSQFEANLKSQMSPTVKTAPTPAAAPQPQAPQLPFQCHHSKPTADDTNMVLEGPVRQLRSLPENAPLTSASKKLSASSRNNKNSKPNSAKAPKCTTNPKPSREPNHWRLFTLNLANNDMLRSISSL